jgi:hypothetical protein
MKAWTVKFKSFNREDYGETVSGKNEKEARKNANKMVIKHDDRDTIESIEEDTTVKSWY